MASPAPRSADVARLAGVSRKTVSRVLNDEPYVSEEARSRVLAVAEELGYRRNHAARTPASGRTRSLGVVALGTAGYGSASLLVHSEQAVQDAGHALRVIDTPDGAPEGIAGTLESLLEQGVDGAVVSEPDVKGEVPLRVDVPVFFLGAPPSFTATRTLTVSVGAHELAEHPESYRSVLRREVLEPLGIRNRGLEHSGSSNGTMLATFEQHTSGTPAFPIYRSTDNRNSWTRSSDVADTRNGWGMRAGSRSCSNCPPRSSASPPEPSSPRATATSPPAAEPCPTTAARRCGSRSS
ncbi:LacI family DNA-binding transcriptional regulator [Streptomyces fuscichromogenes]|uniref:LacI family DNA-binding transcriptional regulator n=1 Tax=Streptomyces fuscichromogenes TaxID=1324013 RepID=UPI00381C83D9